MRRAATLRMGTSLGLDGATGAPGGVVEEGCSTSHRITRLSSPAEISFLPPRQNSTLFGADLCAVKVPACSRVCPEHAIMFPDYKSPAIAGAAVGAITGLKIDLTRLFGGTDAITIAAQERDRELVQDGRAAVGLSVGIPKRQADKSQAPKDDLDKLTDLLDALDI